MWTDGFVTVEKTSVSSWKRLAASALLVVPCFVWGQYVPSATVFGKPPTTWTLPPWWDSEIDGVFEPPPQVGIPLTCANASTAIRQLNSGNSPGMQAANGWIEGEYPPGAGLPDYELPMRGFAAQLVPSTYTDHWAAPPPGSQWVYMAWENDLEPPEYIAYPVAIYIPTAADAAKMRVTMQYRAMEQLIGIYRNDIGSPNTLTPTPQPITTSQPGSNAGSVALNSGWQQGDNWLTFVVKGSKQMNEAEFQQMYTGFAAAFSAECYTPPPAPVPTLGEWSLMLLGLLASGLGVQRLRRRT